MVFHIQQGQPLAAQENVNKIRMKIIRPLNQPIELASLRPEESLRGDGKSIQRGKPFREVLGRKRRRPGLPTLRRNG